MHVFSGMTPSDTGTDATSPKNTLRGRQSAGHTQGTPGHLGIHLFSRWQRLCRPDLAHPTPRHASWAPEAPLSFRTEVSNARSAHYNPVPWRATADLAGWSPSRCPRASAAHPRKHLSTAICRCMYMYVYVRIYVYVCICTYNSECVRICLYIRICMYICLSGTYTQKLEQTSQLYWPSGRGNPSLLWRRVFET